ncbi:semaphorin-4G [Amia ocellicauda]|uniref:semaphorin-4G n=1 Tax=Amia ocellicauda TaxID=2972642 RepID=UPI0034649945
MGACVVLLLQLYSCVAILQGYPFRPALDLDVTPRITVLYNGLLGAHWFNSSTLNYSTLLLEEEEGILYVGARGAVFALNSSSIDGGDHVAIDWKAPLTQKQQCWNKGKDKQTECFNYIRFLQRFNETHLYACGTYAFHPLCTYIDTEQFQIMSAFEEGRDKCPRDPAKGYTGLIVDGEMYTASQYEFRSLSDIRRNVPFHTLKTEEAPKRWLDEADFVGSALVRESVNSSIGDDDKIYFFFTEKSDEQTTYYNQAKVARVARVCKGDGGGRRTLQKKWTSFLKARLVCSIPDYDFHFNILRSVFVLESQGWRSSIFYGVFGSQWKNVKASAICRYSIEDVEKVFDGPYMESEDSTTKWTKYTGKVPEPRPGSCITAQFRARGFNSSWDLPDNVLDFVRRHPLMAEQVRPQQERPLLLKRNVDYTKIAVHRVVALDGQQYDVLFIGTDGGWLHRAVAVGPRVHIIEEMQLFNQPQPIDSLVISEAQRSIYVGSSSGVLQLPLSSCHRYLSCFDCIFARDPYCGWDGERCAEIAMHYNSSSLTQDIQNGNTGCENGTGEELAGRRQRSVLKGDDVLLQCELSSNLAVPQWTVDGQELSGYGLDSGYRIGTDGLLIVEARPEQSGNYSCYASENGFRAQVATYEVRVHLISLPSHPRPTQSSTLLPPVPLPSRPEYQTFKSMEAMYISLIGVLGGLCLVLTIVLLYLTTCMRSRRGKYTMQGPRAGKRSSHMELQTISSNCAGKREAEGDTPDGLLQIVPGEGQASPNKEPPPPPPPPPPLPSSEYANGLSATLPSVLRKMNGNSYVLLRQSDAETTSPLYHSFTEELNRILEKRKHTQLLAKPDESSV